MTRTLAQTQRAAGPLESQHTDYRDSLSHPSPRETKLKLLPGPRTGLSFGAETTSQRDRTLQISLQDELSDHRCLKESSAAYKANRDIGRNVTHRRNLNRQRYPCHLPSRIMRIFVTAVSWHRINVPYMFMSFPGAGKSNAGSRQQTQRSEISVTQSQWINAPPVQ